MREQNWQSFSKHFYDFKDIQLDISKVQFEDEYPNEMEPRLRNAWTKIKELESGAITNPDEDRMVGHYWLRNPELAPTAEIAGEIRQTIGDIKAFAQQIHNGSIRGQRGEMFRNVLVIGIGGSGLGPKFVSDALDGPDDKLKLFFVDNTDPDGIDRIHSLLRKELASTLTIVISKSGGTLETRNGMEEFRLFYQKQGLNFTKHAVSVTGKGSLLERVSKEENWLNTFPMWDWVGGRTSVLSAVGLLPLALQGINIDLLLEGAKVCDELTRREDTQENPSALLAMAWHKITGGQGGKQMIILPYKDRLELFTKYLQQLVMESLGKEKDLNGNSVHQGIAVFGNKGSTDQHSYVQQLLDGPDNFFVTFIEILKDREDVSPLIAEGSTSGDYLHAFFLGTRKALTLKGRESITITIREISERSLGTLIALFERAVSIYAILVNINAYHQPAVELGKKGAGQIIELKNQVVSFLSTHEGKAYTVDELSKEWGKADPEEIFKILQHLAHNPDSGVSLQDNREGNIFTCSYQWKRS